MVKNTKITIVTGEIRYVQDDGVLVYLKSLKRFGICSFENFSDFKENIPKLTSVGNVKKFCYLNTSNENGYVLLSYKVIHPEEIARKNKTIPTASHCLNLYWHVKKQANIPQDSKEIKLLYFCDLCI